MIQTKKAVCRLAHKSNSKNQAQSEETTCEECEEAGDTKQTILASKLNFDSNNHARRI